MRNLTAHQLSFIKQMGNKGIVDELEMAHRMLVLDDTLYLEDRETKTWSGWSIREVAEAIKHLSQSQHD